MDTVTEFIDPNPFTSRLMDDLHHIGSDLLFGLFIFLQRNRNHIIPFIKQKQTGFLQKSGKQTVTVISDIEIRLHIDQTVSH